MCSVDAEEGANKEFRIRERKRKQEDVESASLTPSTGSRPVRGSGARADEKDMQHTQHAGAQNVRGGRRTAEAWQQKWRVRRSGNKS
jgi:hypothetical protein